MSNDIKKFEGSVTVDTNSDITPISREPIDKIDASEWENLSFEKLTDQYTMLQTRIERARTMGRPDLIKPMERGAAYLLQLINEKRPHDGVSLL